MPELPDTVNFDRAAECYDATRDVGDEATADTIDHLASGLDGHGDVLEIGVGTGFLALPLASRGLFVVGIDVSAAMLAKLRQKAAGDGHVRVLEADARRLPFAGGTFSGAYARHVLHLIPRWQVAIAELCRVVGDGVILVDTGSRTPEWEELWREIAPVLGPEAERPGLEIPRDGVGALDDAFGAAGATPEGVTRFSYPERETMADVIDEMERRSPSWTWAVSDEALQEAIGITRRWTLQRLGRLDAPLSERFEVRWHRYRVTD
jgi:SAM-dependent methyltransferase